MRGLTIILPVHNEREGIEEYLEHIIKVMSPSSIPYELFGKKVITRTIDHLTKGSSCSILDAAKDLIENDDKLLIELADVLRDLRLFHNAIRNHSEDITGIIPVQPDTTSQRDLEVCSPQTRWKGQRTERKTNTN